MAFTVTVAVFSFIMIPMPDRCPKALFIGIGNVLLSCGIFLLGPSKVFELPNLFSLMIGGMLVSGVGRALATSFAVAYAMQRAEFEFEGDDEKAKETISFLESIVLYSVALFLPVLSSLLYDSVGFEWAMDILGGILVLWTLAFFLHLIFRRK